MTDALWYFARGSGVVALVLLTVVVVLGIGARSGRPAFGLPRFAVSLVHRNAALLAVVFLAGHVIGLLFDPYAQLRLFEVIVPFVGNYRPVWQGLGTLGNPRNHGLMLHAALAVDTGGVPLGLLHAQTWARPENERGKAQTRRKRRPVHRLWSLDASF